MKTIQEFTNEQVEKLTYGIFEEPVIDAINDTIEFAQRWIPVEEELPGKNRNVLLKRGKPFDKYEITGFQRYAKFYSNETAKEITSVTHWRPIELK